ncbi:hypothetical protein DRJ24_00295 [Candidatus Acetothermia bacterium]|nr:MAG: hypothetical protein DRJ24_00295 [Candidatus Acetothermia bacterium]
MILTMSLANGITIARGLLIAPILLLLFSGNRMGALSLFLIACAGDVLDGLVARARKEITTWGKVLDPTVDKALYLSVLSALAVRGDLSLLALTLFLIPQLGLGVGALILHVRARKVQGARILGKAASALAFLAILFFIAAWPGRESLLYAAIGTTYIAGIDYLLAARSLQGSSP